MEEIVAQEVFRIFGIPVTDIVVHTWIIMAVLIPLAYVAGRNLQIRPRPWQHLVEMFAEYISGLISQRTKRHVPGLFEIATTMMLYITVANLLGLFPGLKAPTRSLSTTLALSVVSFVSVHYFGVVSRGPIKYLRSLAEPIGVSFLLVPLNLIGELSRIISMAVRLFGNVAAGEIIGAVMYRLLPLVAPLPFNLLASITGILQALVFTFLTVVFITDSVGEEEDEEEALVKPKAKAA